MEKKPKFGIGTVIKHKFYGWGRIVGFEGEFYVIHFKGEMKKIPFTFSDMHPIEENGDPELDLVKTAIYQILSEQGWIDCNIEMSSRWTGGSIKLIPGKEGTQEKEVSIDSFFKKIISIREKLRVLEQKINNNPKLEQEEKLEYQSYITRCYGALTTFNILFADKFSYFKGSGKSKKES